MPTTDLNSSKALGADQIAALYNLNGSGLKIGIISDSYNNKGGAPADVASGDLPQGVTVLRDLASGGADEGRAMMELAYRIAPGAQYFFQSGYSDPGSSVPSIQSCADAVTALQKAGCNVIIDDLGFGGAEGFYQVGTVLDNAISAAVASGVDYFSAAGNDSKNYYEHGFTPLTTTIAGVNGGQAVVANDFGNGSPYLSLTIAQGSKLSGTFEWAQPFASIGTSGKSAGNSLALYLLDSAGNVVASATGDQTGNDPVQQLSFTNNAADTSFRLVVVQNGGTVPSGQLFKLVSSNGGVVFNDPNANKGSGNIYGHELLGVQNSLGAINYAQTPAFAVSPSVPTDFTSVGPGQILFDAQGNALPAPVNAGEPNFSAAQGSNTAVPGFAPFDGTSAAAPNAGAVAALVLQANTKLTTAQVTSLLAQSVIPEKSTLSDTGAGLIQARAAVELAAAAGGDRWTTGRDGDWTTAASWSTGAAPTDAVAVSVGDNVGGSPGKYTLTASASGLRAGSIAVGTAAGSSATLSITGGDLSVGGSSAGNSTANDLLVSNNGALSVSGGALSVVRSLNTNNGAVRVTAGSVTAGDYSQNAGSLALGGGSGSADMTLTGGGLNLTGGSATLSSGGTLRASAATISACTLSVGSGASFIDAASLALDSAVASILAGGSAAAAALSMAATSAASALSVLGLFNDSGSLTATSTACHVDVGGSGVMTIGGGTSQAGINLSGSGQLVLSSTDSKILMGGYTGLISGLISGQDLLDFSGLNYSATDTTSYDRTTGQFNVVDGTTGSYRASVFLNAAESYSTFLLSPDSNNKTVVRAVAPVCFCTGVRILTARGEVAVEDLRVGDLAVTTSGAHRPVRWIGRQAVDCVAHPRPQEVWPVRVSVGALGEGRPARDLWVSPGHALCLDLLGEVLVPASALVNGATVAQVDVPAVAYWHVELDGHDILLADCMPAESYIDTGNRAFFGTGRGALDPERAPASLADYCRPFHGAGPVVAAARSRLRARAEALGWRLGGEPLGGLHLLADGARLEPEADGLSVRFAVPAGARDVWLCSEASVPLHGADDPRADPRPLGLCVGALRIDDGLSGRRAVAPDDGRLDAAGWHAAEPGHRWTAGRARLDPALWAGCRGLFFLRLDLAAACLPGWRAPAAEARPGLRAVRRATDPARVAARA